MSLRATGALRALIRALVVAGCLGAAFAEFGVLAVGRSLNTRQRTRWLQRWCRRVLRVLGIEVRLRGRMPESGLLVANHLSYLDILVFGALAPTIFVAKIEVRSWAIFGRMAHLGGSLFIDRRNLRQVRGVVVEAERVLRSGALLVVFPEATTTDGSALLRFAPALFEAAVGAGSEVGAAHISYTLAGGRFGRELCWFGVVQPVRHLANCFAQKKIFCELQLWPERRRFASRKEAAAATRAQVEQLAAGQFAGEGAAARLVSAS